MDEPGQKTTTIDDLLNELSKPGPQPSSQPPIPQPSSPSSSPRPPVPPVSSSIPPKPVAPPAPSISQPSSSAPNLPKEYQSSIRTMQGDISSVKAGQKPLGVETPRKIEPPVQSSPGLQPRPTSPTQPSQTFKIPSVELGPTEKSKPVPPLPGAPVIKPQPPVPEKIYPPSSSITIPSSSGRNFRWPLIAGIAVVVVMVVLGIWFFFLRNPEVAIETPTPTITPTETPIIKNLVYYFPNTQVLNLPSGTNLTENIFSSLNFQTGQFERVIVAAMSSDPAVSYIPNLNLAEVLERSLIYVPQELKENFNVEESAIMIYGQGETYDSKGVRIMSPTGERRLALISEVVSPLTAQNAMTKWELTLPQEMNQLFGLSWKSSMKVEFLDNIHNGLIIRYMNFPYPDRSIDYAFATASNGKTYLVISNSRESMYSILDIFTEELIR